MSRIRYTAASLAVRKRRGETMREPEEVAATRVLSAPRGKNHRRQKTRRGAGVYRVCLQRNHLSSTRNANAAKRFLGRVLRGRPDWSRPRVINTDNAGCYGPAIEELKTEAALSFDTEHHRAKYLNNVVEAGHVKLKRLIRSSPFSPLTN